jgi:hypothetical protein
VRIMLVGVQEVSSVYFWSCRQVLTEQLQQL